MGLKGLHILGGKPLKDSCSHSGKAPKCPNRTRETSSQGFGLGQSDASTANSGTDAVEVHSKAQSEATEDEKSKEVVQDGEEKLRQPSADILPGPVELSDGPLEVGVFLKCRAYQLLCTKLGNPSNVSDPFKK